MSASVDVLACFACGKKFRNLDSRYLADTRDGQGVFVGPECFKQIQSAGDTGYQPPKGGPRLWPLSVAGVLADMDRCTRELPGEESEILCQARAAVAELMDDVQDFLTDTANGLGPDPERLHAALARCGVAK